MAKPKPKPKIDIEFEWADNVFPKVEYVRKLRLKCCPAMENASTISSFYYTDKHYPESTDSMNVN